VTAAEELVLPTDISFNDFYLQICKKMGLENQGATWGYGEPELVVCDYIHPIPVVNCSQQYQNRW
jgi:hypothetical protein